MSQLWETPSTLHERIKLIRKRINVSQAEFAKPLGVNPAHISRIESGKSVPSEQLLRLIAHTYDIRWLWLIQGNGRMVLNFDEYQARVRELGLSSFGAYLTIFYQINVFLLTKLVADLEAYALKSSGPLPPDIIKSLKAIKEFLPLDRIFPLIDKILANPTESEPAELMKSIDVPVDFMAERPMNVVPQERKLFDEEE